MYDGTILAMVILTLIIVIIFFVCFIIFGYQIWQKVDKLDVTVDEVNGYIANLEKVICDFHKFTFCP
jgi:cell division protein FtsL